MYNIVFESKNRKKRPKLSDFKMNGPISQVTYNRGLKMQLII